MPSKFKHSWDHDRDPVNDIRLTRRGVAVAIIVFLLFLSIVGGIEH